MKNTDSDSKVNALHYANDLLKNCCKRAKQTETIRNYQTQVWKSAIKILSLRNPIRVVSIDFH